MRKLLCLTLLALSSSPAFAAEFGAIAAVGDTPFQFSGFATDGSAISLGTLKGKVVLIYLFSTQAGAGMMELQQIQRYIWPLYKSDQFSIVAIGREAEAPELKAIGERMKIGFPIIPDPNKEIFLHFASKGHPRAYLIGRTGKIEDVSLGYTDDEVARISHRIQEELTK
jgi:peroxiredoxin